MKADIWAEPAYMAPLRANLEAFATLTPVQIEQKLASQPGVEELTGLSQHEHRRRAMARMFPSRVDHPWREKVLWSYHQAKCGRIKELMFLGASNSTKTSSIADLLVEVWMEEPGHTTIFITSPFEDATDTGIWARVLEQFQEAKDNCPELPGRLKPSQRQIVQWDNNPLSFIKAVSVDKVGKLVGKKSKVFTLGMMLIVADELPEFPQKGAALVSVMNNLISVKNMMLIGAGNFANPQDALGVFCEPDLPGGYADLRVHQHYEWRSRRGGMVVRFDGDQSPGMDEPHKYFFLPGEEYRAQLALQSGGVKSPDYYRYWHSFPLVGSEEFTVTNMVKIRASGALEEGYQWTGGRIITGSYMDPGFGGDAAVLQPWRFGSIREGALERQVWEAWGPPITVPIDVESGLTAEEQIVDFHREWAERNKVPPENCGFDGSMRASIVQEYGRRWSIRVMAMDSGGSATDRPHSVIKQFNSKTGEEKKVTVTWKEKTSNLITELWMSVAQGFISRQIRGLSSNPEAQKQLCARVWEYVGAKKKMQTKKEYKENNSSKSPNEADAIVGGFEHARRLGFRLLMMAEEKKSAMDVIKGILQEHAVHSVQLPHQSPALPSGRLRSMARQSTTRNVRSRF